MIYTINSLSDFDTLIANGASPKVGDEVHIGFDMMIPYIKKTNDNMEEMAHLFHNHAQSINCHSAIITGADYTTKIIFHQ